jgi:hypothetical protein
MNDRFEPLESGEVISVQHEAQVLSGHRTFRAGELSDAIKNYLENAIGGWSEEKNGWFTTKGIDCEALRFGSNGWQKGRIRLCLEFCPDELDPGSHSINHSSISTPVSSTVALTGQSVEPVTAVSAPVTATDIRNENSIHQSIITPANVVPAIEPDQHQPITAAVTGIAAGGSVAMAALATPDFSVSPKSTIPSLSDAILELEEHSIDPNAVHSGNLDEIAFDFDRSSDGQGRMIPNGTMELDLTDLGLDFSEHDLLNFESDGGFDAAEEFTNIQDIGRLENSGVIDEVWNEMKGSWPGIN